MSNRDRCIGLGSPRRLGRADRPYRRLQGSRVLVSVTLRASLAIAVSVFLVQAASMTAQAAGGPEATELQPGWNLVGWTGDETDVDVVFLEVPQALVVYVWDAKEQRFLWAHRDGLGDLESLSLGRGLWLFLDGDEAFLWRRTHAPLVEFDGEYTAVQKEELQAYVDDVLAFFFRRYGVTVPGLTVRFDGDPPGEYCGGYAEGTISIMDGCRNALPHEYSHAVQEYLATLDAEGKWGTFTSPLGPAWLSEGVANHAAAVYEDLIDLVPISQWVTYTTLSGLVNATSLEALESDMTTGGDVLANYHLASLVARWIVEEHGEQALYGFYRLRSSTDSWQEAFIETFGEPAAFYRAFEEYRDGLGTALGGRVVGPDGEGQPGVRVDVVSVEADHRQQLTTDGSGIFSGLVLEGAYHLSLFTPCHVGWYGGEAYTASLDAATVLNMPVDARMDIAIQLPRPAAEMCKAISGTVLSNDTPLAGVWIAVQGQHDRDGYSGGTSTDEGRFEILVRRGGDYALEIYSDVVRRCEVQSPGRQLPGDGTLVTIGDQDLSGVRMTVEVGPRQDSMWIACTLSSEE